MASSTALVAEKSHDYQYSRHFGALFQSWRHLFGGRDNQDFTLVWIQAFIPLEDHPGPIVNKFLFIPYSALPGIEVSIHIKLQSSQNSVTETLDSFNF